VVIIKLPVLKLSILSHHSDTSIGTLVIFELLDCALVQFYIITLGVKLPA